MDPNDFETVVKLNEKDIEILENLFAQYFVRCNNDPDRPDCSLQSALFKKILAARTAQIIEARAAGKLKSPEQPPSMVQPPLFGGKPGEPVPAVDPDDVKSVWKLGKDAEARGSKAIGDGLKRQACKPGADTEAVLYRTSLLWMMTQMPPEVLERFMREDQSNDAVFRAAAKVPAEWMGVGIVRNGPPFDVNEFLRLCGETV